MFDKYLKDIGLSEKEAAIYTTLLSLDKASIAEISKKANVKRPTTYVILDSLTKKGLVSETTINKKTYYLALSPEKLDAYVDRQIYLLQENKKSLDLIIPQLKNMSREGGEKPVVQFFDGKEGVMSSNLDIFTKKAGEEPMYIVYSRDLVRGLFSEKETELMRNTRLSLGVKSKSIYTSQDEDRPSDEMADRIRFNSEKYPIKSDITIYGDNVRIAVLGKRISGISIKSSELAETLKSLIKYIFDNK